MKKISARGVALYKQLEGFRSKPYTCSAGKLTIGYGHVILPDEHFTEVTLDEANTLLEKDLERHESDLRALLPATVLDKLSQNQYDALVLFIMNVGYTKELLTSNVVKFLKAGLYNQAITYWQQWDKVVDPSTKMLVVSQGLQNRRNAEIRLFQS